MLRTINIESDCSGDFTIDSVGIRSNGPVALKKSYWKGNTLKLEGYDTTITTTVSFRTTLLFGFFGGLGGVFFGRMVQRPYGTFIGGFFGALLGGSFGHEVMSSTTVYSNTPGSSSSSSLIISGGRLTIVNGKGSTVVRNIVTNGDIVIDNKKVTVGGVPFFHETSSELTEKKVYEENWNQRFRFGSNEVGSRSWGTSVELAHLNVSGAGTYTNSLPLSDSALITSSGVSDINIIGSNPNTKLSIKKCGVGSIKGSGDLSELRIRNSGVGSISGFTVGKFLHIDSSGVGNIRLGARSTCSVTQNVSGVGNVKVTRK
ncbi:Hypothetical protein HVR_LOCUS1025 [uncultured virus]|nr:Hypothetical protein HVR_LOCUS1025 [uncultured virus]